MGMFDFKGWCHSYIAKYIDITQLSLRDRTTLKREIDIFDTKHLHPLLKIIFNCAPQIQEGSVRVAGRYRSSYLLYKLGLLEEDPRDLDVELELLMFSRHPFCLEIHPTLLANFNYLRRYSMYKPRDLHFEENAGLTPCTGPRPNFTNSFGKSQLSLDDFQLNTQEEFISFVCLLGDFTLKEANQLRAHIAMQSPHREKKAHSMFIEKLYFCYRDQREDLWSLLNSPETPLLESTFP